MLKVPSKTKTPHYTAHYQRDGQEWTDEGQHIPWVDVLNGPVKWDSTVEIGEKQHRMHAHCVVVCVWERKPVGRGVCDGVLLSAVSMRL